MKDFLRSITAADVRGAARLVTKAVTGVADIAEGVHAAVQATVAKPLGRRRGRARRARGIAGFVYKAVRGVARRTGRGADAAAGAVEAALPGSATRDEAAPPPPNAARAAVIAALNGVVGDALAAESNPLVIPMHLRYAGRSLALDAASVARAVSDPSETLLVQVHGLCMNDDAWVGGVHDQGAVLADGIGATRLALRYNTGRHISENGRAFADVLDALVAAWPRPVRRVVVVGHSMGGLVARSAFHYAAEAGQDWPARKAALVTLGSPHHGTVLERLGSRVDALLGATRFTAPFARISRLRSAGVTDLRYGNLLDDDWAGRDRFARAPDPRRVLPLPDGVACYLVAATTGRAGAHLRSETVGDGLVPVRSALGYHADPARTLRVPPGHRWVVPETTHFELLRRPDVTAHVLAWLTTPAADAVRTATKSPPAASHAA